jgi:hypothetical protein
VQAVVGVFIDRGRDVVVLWPVVGMLRNVQVDTRIARLGYDMLVVLERLQYLSAGRRKRENSRLTSSPRSSLVLSSILSERISHLQSLSDRYPRYAGEEAVNAIYRE